MPKRTPTTSTSRLSPRTCPKRTKRGRRPAGRGATASPNACATTRWACCGSPSTTRRCPCTSAKPVCGGASPPTNTATTADSRVRSTSARAGGWKAAISSPRRTPCPKPKGSARRSTAVRSPRATTLSTRTPCANANRDAYTSTAFSATPRRSTRFPTV